MSMEYLGNGLFEYRALVRHFHSAVGSAGTTNLNTKVSRLPENEKSMPG